MSLEKRIPMTNKGVENLRKELNELKSVERPKIIAAIAEARAHGDLKENAEYHAAKEQQAFLEGRILDIESKLANAQVIDITKLPQNGRVVFGTTVVIQNTETDEEARYQIVGDEESDLKQNMISVHSPIARAVIGKQEGDIATVITPNGEVDYEILEVLYIA